MKPVLLAITSGDRDGVGLEVARKALNKIGPVRTARFLLACSDDSSATRELSKLNSPQAGGFHPIVISSQDAPLEAAAELLKSLKPNELIIWRDHGNEAAWVKTCAELSLKKKISGLVTGPVSKGRFKKLNSKFMGHTGLLAALARTPVQQGYVGEKLSVVLATDHLPLSKVERALNTNLIRRTIQNAQSMKPLLAKSLQKKPLAILGLNPHAGEDGLIGAFERRLKLPRGLLGPIPPDAAFTVAMRATYSTVVALYHDQGLIPFKMLHGQDSGFQVSLGLPFVRTSVDHGTARDIFGKGQANPGSMIDAIRGAIKMAQSRLDIRKS